ncbi:DUF1361 domain-containing protein [Flagellimonas sp. S174]|uniref:DUF1361 domain-containing protein n=1 Tax=Flagellimonas sp. S174 TaxID=3410790 RepID=UPI003BF5759F
MFAVVLIIIRVVTMETYFYSFLLWNLFLAVLPYMLSQAILLYFDGKTSKAISYALWGTWLLLLPNAPYLITDLIHLHNPHSNWLWFDLFMVFVFACNGVILFVLSLNDFFTYQKIQKNRHLVTIIVCFLSGYGIYAGRFLRFNSWDLFLKPTTLFSQMGISLGHAYTWLMSMAFGLFLWISFNLFRWMRTS